MIRVLLFGVSSGVGEIETFLMKHINLNQIQFKRRQQGYLTMWY